MGSRIFRYGRAAIGLCPGLAGHEPRRARQNSRKRSSTRQKRSESRKTTKHAHTIGWAELTGSKLHLLKGEWAKARDLLEKWINMPGTLDVAILLPWAATSLAWTLAQLGDASEALSCLREGEEYLKRQEAAGIFVHRGWSYQALARGCLLLGRLDEARRLADRSLNSQRQPSFVAHARCILGDLAIHPDYFDVESADAHYRAALTIAKPRGMRPLAAHCHSGLAALIAAPAIQVSPASTSPLRRTCTATWTWASGSRRLRPNCVAPCARARLRFAKNRSTRTAHRLCGRKTLAEGQLWK